MRIMLPSWYIQEKMYGVLKIVLNISKVPANFFFFYFLRSHPKIINGRPLKSDV